MKITIEVQTFEKFVALKNTKSILNDVLVNIGLSVRPMHVIVPELFSSRKTYYMKTQWKIRRNSLIIMHNKPLSFD